MPKRKRAEAFGTGQEDGPPRTKRQLAAEKQLHESRTQVFRALKLAKGFERQKLARRQKEAGKTQNEQEGERILSEIEALQKLDLHATADAHLFKTLLKIKAVANSPNLPEDVVIGEKAVLSQATANVTGRMFGSNPVRTAIGEAVAAMQKVIGAEVQAKTAQESKAQKSVRRNDSPVAQAEAEAEAKAEDGTSESAWDGIDAEEDLEGPSDQDDDLDEEEEVEGENGERLENGVTNDIDWDSDQLAAFESRIVGSSDEDSGADEEESDAESDTSFPIIHNSAKKGLSLSPPPLTNPSKLPKENNNTTNKDTNKSTKDPPAKPSAKATSFLPSLTMGGYWSGSESEPEDLESEMIAPPKKNRRGQRARQAIFEKKFGSNAKHLTGEKRDANASQKGRDQGWDAKRGASGRDDLPLWKRKKLGLVGKDVRAPPGVEGSNAVKLGKVRNFGEKKKRDDEGKLHPSWEAKKKLKESGGQGGMGVAFQGKKVVFD